MFGLRKQKPVPDEARRFLESANAQPDCPDPYEAEDINAAEASAVGEKAHFDVMNVLVLSLVIIFFGTVFLVFTDQQDYSGHRNISLDGLISGRYFSDIEKKFNSSLPLRDLTHNAEQIISACFGIGNTPDLIDLKDNDDDPYSIENNNGFTPITSERRRSIGGEDDEHRATSAAEADAMTATTEDDGSHKKLSGITMTTTYDPASYTSPTSPTTTNTREPGATTTTTTAAEIKPAPMIPVDPSEPDDSSDDSEKPSDEDEDN